MYQEECRMAVEQIYEREGETNAAVLVNNMVANLGLLHVKLHQYHWHVQGPHFFTLHAQFEELYNGANDYFDQFAERLISMGKTPYSTLEEFLENAVIQEKKYEKKMSETEMVEDIVNDYRTLRSVTEKAIELAGNENDAVTEDMMIAYKDSVDTTIWMLQAYLGKGALEGEK